VGTAVSELGMVAKMSKEQPAETFEPEQLDSKQFRKQFEVRRWGEQSTELDPVLRGCAPGTISVRERILERNFLWLVAPLLNQSSSRGRRGIEPGEQPARALLPPPPLHGMTCNMDDGMRACVGGGWGGTVSQASTASKVVVTVEPIPPIKAIVEGGFQVNLHRLSGLGGDRFGRGVGQVCVHSPPSSS
jgi:hypothetical protein